MHMKCLILEVSTVILLNSHLCHANIIHGDHALDRFVRKLSVCSQMNLDLQVLVFSSMVAPTIICKFSLSSLFYLALMEDEISVFPCL